MTKMRKRGPTMAMMEEERQARGAAENRSERKQGQENSNHEGRTGAFGLKWGEEGGSWSGRKSRKGCVDW
jgi:hypothetical protein